MKYIMAMDQGTTSSRCILFDHSGKIRASAQKEFRQIFPKPGWVEHDPEEIWQTMLQVCREAMAKLNITAEDVAAIGVTNQRETTILWDKATGKPIANAIVWQCRRTAPLVDELVAAGHGETIRAKTGLVPDAYFSGTKIRWLLDHVPGARQRAEAGEILFGTVETWLIWKLTGGKTHVTDQTNASRTMLFNIHTLKWDEELLSLLRIPAAMLPQVAPSSHVYGEAEPEWLGGPIPIAGAAGDQQCALFGQSCFEAGSMKNTYGTGCFLLMNTGKTPVESHHGLVTTIAVGLEDHTEYALEGSVFVAGAAIQWLRDSLKVIENSKDSEPIAESVEDCAGGYVVPAFTGLGAPYWCQNARGMVVGMTRGFTNAHLIRATLESLAYQTWDVAHAMKQDLGQPISSLKVDGGACANNFLMQMQSDLLRCDVSRPECIETTALGAAYLAGLAVGFWQSREELSTLQAMSRAFTPVMPREKSETLLKGWHRAVRAALAWAEDEE